MKSFWEEAFTPNERDIIERAFTPLGEVQAPELANSDDPSKLSLLASHLRKEELRHLAYRLLDRANAIGADHLPILTRHFYYHSQGEFFYRWRDVDEGALERAIAAFTKQIELGERVAHFFRTDRNWGFVPGHAGYRQMRVIEEKRGNLTAAKALCEKAKTEGWSDDWDKHIARIDRKIAKASK